MTGKPISRPAIILGVLAGALTVCAIAVSCALAAGTPLAISPLTGTPDASPNTQISFLGVPASDLSAIVVSASRSGHHEGKLEPYASEPGASFLPNRPFQPGERVTVTATVTAGSSKSTVGTTFTIADPYTLPREAASSKPPSSTASLQSFHSQRALHPPSVNILTNAADPALGDIFISPDSGPGPNGAMIVEPSGQLVWFEPMAAGIDAMNLRVQQYYGKPVLTWWQGEVIEGHGQGEDVIDNTSYHRIGTVHAGNGLHADLHEFQITPQGTALLTAYEPVHYDLSPYGGSSDGLVDDCVAQEIDIKTGLVMFEWHALGHVSIADSYSRVPHIPADIFDFFHINSIQQQSDGDLLIGSRNTWAAYMISGQSGGVLWRLGGKHSSFTLGPGVRFAWQHDPEIDSDGKLSVFDNEDTPPEGSASRALRIELNFQAKTATLLGSLEHPGSPLLSPSQGNVQVLENEDRLVGWGQAGYISEFSPSGQLTFDMQLPAPTNTYRAYRSPWSAQPGGTPALSASSSGSTVTAYASWNGATNVASWRLLEGSSSKDLKPVKTFPRTGFESELSAHTHGAYVAVQALAASGEVLGTSPTSRT